MKRIILSTIAGACIVALPAVSSAISVRIDRSASSNSGGVTVSEGGTVVTGNESSSVNLQTVLSGTRGRVEITTEKDGVTTTESHDISTPGGGSVIITPTPAPQSESRPPRESRGSVAVAQSNINTGSAAQNAVQTKTQIAATAKPSTASASVQSIVRTYNSGNGSVLAVADGARGASVRSEGSAAVSIVELPRPMMLSNSIADFVTRILAMFGWK